MPDKKISELTALSAPDSADVFAIVDVSASITKKITYANLLAQIETDIGTSSDYVLKVGDTMTGNLLFTDALGIDTTSTGGTDTLNVGITNADEIFIGKSTQRIRILSSGTTYYNDSHSFLDDAGNSFFLISDSFYAFYAGGGANSPSINHYAKDTQNRVVTDILYAATTNATPTELTLDGNAGSGATNRIPVPESAAMSVIVSITVKQASSANSKQFLRQFCISNNGGATALRGSVATLGTDTGDALAGASVAITANDTDDCINITVTGIAATNLHWSAHVVSSQVLYE